MLLLKGKFKFFQCNFFVICSFISDRFLELSDILSRALREEVKTYGINILAMCPGNMDTEMNPKGGSSQSAKVDRLPFLNMKKITKKSIQFAKNGHAIYTPGKLYKLYRFASKIMPSALMVKIIKNSFN